LELQKQRDAYDTLSAEEKRKFDLKEEKRKKKQEKSQKIKIKM
jgi:hypothetical protein